MNISAKLKCFFIVVLVGLFLRSAAIQAATFSSTRVEALYGYNYKRGAGFSETNEAILVLANTTKFNWGDSFFFLETTNVDDVDKTGGTHAEFNVRYRFWKSNGLVKSVYGIVQADMDSNSYTQKVTKMAGVSIDWNAPEFMFLKTFVQFRDDPILDGSAIQFNLAWNKAFNIGKEKFSFGGFIDWTSNEGKRSSNLLSQPQLIWHVSKSLGFGFEYQYWKNRIGIKGLDEKAPQIMVRWTF